MIKNFEILSETSVIYECRVYDLHNDYAFNGFELNSRENYITLRWEKITSEDEFLSIEFADLEFLRVRGIDLDIPRKEDACLDFLGKLNQADVEIMDGFIPNYEDPAAHLIFSFNGGLAIKIFSASAKISVSNIES